MARTRTIRRAPRKATGKNKTRSKAKKSHTIPFVPDSLQAFVARRFVDIFAFVLGLAGLFILLSLVSYNQQDPSWNTASDNADMSAPAQIFNWMGHEGAMTADLFVQTLGAAGFAFATILCIWAVRIFARQTITALPIRIIALLIGTMFAGIALAQIPFDGWNPQPYLGGSFGTLIIQKFGSVGQNIAPVFGYKTIAILAAFIAVPTLLFAANTRKNELAKTGQLIGFITFSALSLIASSYIAIRNWIGHYNDEHYTPKTLTMFKGAFQNPIKISLNRPEKKPKAAPTFEPQSTNTRNNSAPAPAAKTEQATPSAPIEIVTPKAGKALQKSTPDNQHKFSLAEGEEWEFPCISLLEEVPDNANVPHLNEAALRKNAELLQNVLADFNIEGDITSIHPGPVVTLYELEPAPGTKSSKVISLADDIARSMSAISVRVAVVPGRNVIGIELPNKNRQIVYMQELIASQMFEKTKAHLPLILGKDIGGQPILADLAKMPHLLVAGTTGSGKSVAVNTMILSILYGLSPEKCRFIMIDPKMLELSVYDGIPHLLSPVVTEPGKAVVALKWTVNEMEDRYRAMSKLGVRNIEGYNQRVREAKKNGETIMNKVQTGFFPDSGEPTFEDREMSLDEIPYIIVVVDEFADLMLVAGKDVESAIQRLAQMARAAGIHLIMATQRPSVDVITGVIKANFPTRISFQVTSKVDSRTILGEGGAEQLLGMGDMLYMAPGGRITRVHGPFVSDADVEKVVDDLKSKASPAYIENITDENAIEGSEVMNAMFSGGAGSDGEKVDELYDEAVAIIAREGKASTSFIQRCLQIGYNRAARIIEEMEKQGVVSKANATGKREVLVSDFSDA